MGGVGLVTVELCSPTPGGAHRRGEPGVHHDRFLHGLAELVDRVHRHGAACAIQIGHAGAHARPDVTGHPAVAPSDVPHDVREGDTRRVVPHPLTHGEMAGLAEAYAAAAARCEGELRRQGVSVTLGASPTVRQLVELAPDLVVVATGAVYPVPGLLALLRLPGARNLASLPRLRKLALKLLRQPRDPLPRRLRAAGLTVVVVGDRSGTRGVEAAMRTGYEAARALRLPSPSG
jgi:hypothetical protein